MFEASFSDATMCRVVSRVSVIYIPLLPATSESFLFVTVIKRVKIKYKREIDDIVEEKI